MKFDMTLFKKMFLEKEIKAVLGVFDELDFEFKEFSSFEIVKNKAEGIVLKNKKDIIKIMREQNISSRRTACSWINNVSGDMLESGQYHIYRGMLNPMGPGSELLKIFDVSTDKLVEVGDIKISGHPI